MKRRLFKCFMIMIMLFLIVSCEKSSTDIKEKQTKISTALKTKKSETITTTRTTVIEKFTITFDTNGGSEVPSQTVIKGDKVERPADPVKEGYTFDGWYINSLCFFEYDFSNSVRGNKTIYAGWKEIPKLSQYEVVTSTVDLWDDSIGTRWMKIVVSVTNTGETILSLSDISVDIESASGKLLQNVTYINGYPDAIAPGETGYYYKETTCDFTETDVKAIPYVNLKYTKNELTRYDISDVSINEDKYDGIKIIGRVENNTDEESTWTKIAIVLFDKSGSVISICHTSIYSTLEPAAKIGFSITPFSYTNITPEDIGKYIVIGYPFL